MDFFFTECFNLHKSLYVAGVWAKTTERYLKIVEE